MSVSDIEDQVREHYSNVLQLAKRGDRQANELAMKYASFMTADFDPEDDTTNDFYDALQRIAHMKTSRYPNIDAIETLMKWCYMDNTDTAKLLQIDHELSVFLGGSRNPKVKSMRKPK